MDFVYYPSSALLALPDIVIALLSFFVDSPAGRLRGPKRDGAAADRTDAAYPSASELLVVWVAWDVTTVSPTSRLRKVARAPETGAKKSQGPR